MQQQTQRPTYPMDKQLTRLELFTKVYNEQLDQIVRAETDLALFERLIIKEPNNNEYVKQRQELKRNLDIKRDLLEVLENKIKDEE